MKLQPPAAVLIIDPDDSHAQKIVQAVDRSGHIAVVAPSVDEAKARRGRRTIHLVLFTSAAWKQGGSKYVKLLAESSDPVRVAMVGSERLLRRAPEFASQGIQRQLTEPVSALEMLVTLDELLAGPPLSLDGTEEEVDEEEVEAPEPTPSSRTEAPVDSEEPWADPTEVRAQLHGLANDLRSGNANLKDISPVAIELQGLVGDPETTLPRLVEKIEQDPKLAAAILKASNAAAYRGMPNVLDLESAGRRLGTRRLGEIAQTEALRSAFTSGVKGWSRLLSRMWRTTVVTAQTARDIAEKLGERNLGAVYTMALFHNLGEVLIIDLYQKLGYKAPRTGIADGALEREMDAQHTALGTLLLRSWRMPPSIAAIAFHHHDPGQLPAGTPVCRHAWMIGGAYRAVVEAGYEYKKTKNEGPPVAAAAAALGIKPEMFTDAAEAAIARWTGMD